MNRVIMSSMGTSTTTEATMLTPPAPDRPFSLLRQFVKRKPAAERCELCGLALAPQHAHLLEPATRRLVCSCEACSILFDGRGNDSRYRRIPRRIEILQDFKLSDGQWEGLHLPISLAFFHYSTPAKRVIAMYPSPAGATESLLALESWQDLVADNPVLSQLEPDVEALLVNRIGPARQYFGVPIDECFRLVGLIRGHWRGLSGGTEVWAEIAQFFQSLDERSPRPSGGVHA
jgi:hypothetical protein